eukprot:TRINITY_DN7719_c0_g1_i1.p1 TRINITY_DN7719_c0_g1~~TRINITY_DN7719_c0_g1_i1.p1  ORF type:complete len:334 (+),score=74.23 TRINITY_DN7719_c0_g1_i1:76-1077(+)
MAAGLRPPLPGTVCATIYCVVCLALGWGHVFTLHARPLPGQWARFNDTHWSWFRDAHVSLPFHHSTVPTFPGLVAWCLVLPVFTVAFTAIAGYGWHDCGSFAKGFCVTMATCVLACNFAKNYVGALRPCFYAKCDVSPFTTDPNTEPYCRNDRSEVDEYRKSFPSGHACYSMAAAIYCSLYLLGKARHLFRAGLDSRGVPGTVGFGPWGEVVLAPLWQWLSTVPYIAVAIFISASRVRDNRHHAADILAGAILGAGIAVWGYLLYYPSPYGEGQVDRPLDYHDDCQPGFAVYRASTTAASMQTLGERRESRARPLLNSLGDLEGGSADGHDQT